MADEMTPKPNLIEQYTKSVQERKLEAVAQMQKLMKALDSRRNLPFDPMLMRVAGALLQPTKTGGAGESIGYAATAAADEAQRQVLQNAELAKMEFELFQKQQAQKSAMDEQNFAMQYFGSKRPPAAPVAPVAQAAPVAPVAQAAPVATKPQLTTEALPSSDKLAAPPTTQATVSQAAPPVDQSSQADDEDDPVLAIINPNLYKIKMELRDQARKSAEDRRKDEQLALSRREIETKERVAVEVGGVKISMPKADFDRMTGAVEEKDFDTAKKYYTKYGLDFPFKKDKDGWRRKTASEAAREEAVAKELGQVDRGWKGETYKLDSPQAAEHDQARKEGTLNEFWNKYFIEQGGGTVPSTGPAKTDAAKVEKTPSVEEKAVTQEAAIAREKKRAEERAKSEVKSRDEIIASAKIAMIIERPANQINKIASDPIGSKALGLLENPTVFDAIVGATAEGVSAGPINIGIPAIRPCRKAEYAIGPAMIGVAQPVNTAVTPARICRTSVIMRRLRCRMTMRADALIAASIAQRSGIDARNTTGNPAGSGTAEIIQPE
jgi:hypothetical protein